MPAYKALHVSHACILPRSLPRFWLLDEYTRTQGAMDLYTQGQRERQGQETMRP